MLKNKTVLEVKIGERNYLLECDPNSPLGELHDALAQMINFVIDKMQQQAAMTSPKKCCQDQCSEDV